jgi:hypothetical protein
MSFETVTRVASRTSVLFDAPGDHDDHQGKVLSDEVCSTTSSSSIGRDSDDDVSSERSMDENENEAQSKYNGGALDAMEALEQVLPIRYTLIITHFSIIIKFFFCFLRSNHVNLILDPSFVECFILVTNMIEILTK